jgi:hypothetical protein
MDEIGRAAFAQVRVCRAAGWTRGGCVRHIFAMPHFELSPVETRVLGCLMEKERLTPENYPISLNSLTAACNQTTNRDPVVGYDERSVDDALTNLRQEKLATMIHAAGSRVPKYRHNLPDHYDLAP